MVEPSACVVTIAGGRPAAETGLHDQVARRRQREHRLRARDGTGHVRAVGERLVLSTGADEGGRRPTDAAITRADAPDARHVAWRDRSEDRLEGPARKRKQPGLTGRPAGDDRCGWAGLPRRADRDRAEPGHRCAGERLVDQVQDAVRGAGGRDGLGRGCFHRVEPLERPCGRQCSCMTGASRAQRGCERNEARSHGGRGRFRRTCHVLDPPRAGYVVVARIRSNGTSAHSTTLRTPDAVPSN